MGANTSSPSLIAVIRSEADESLETAGPPGVYGEPNHSVVD